MGLIKRTYHIIIFLFLSFMAISIFFGGNILRQAGETVGIDMFDSLADKADSIKYKINTSIGKIDKIQEERKEKGAEMAKKLKELEKAKSDILHGKD